MAIVEVKNLSVSYEEQKVLSHISFSIEKGDALAVIGPNGSGKTTLFRAIIGAIPYEGEIVKKPNLRVGYVPQKLDLERGLPIAVEEFLSLRGTNNLPGGYTQKEVLDFVNLGANFLKKQLGELSAGELQRVLIAWAIMPKPDLLLFDEPTASVDIGGQETIYELLHNLQDKSDLTLALISHDLAIVYKYANKVLCLNHSEVCFGPPLEVLTSEGLKKLYGGTSKFYKHKNHE